MQQEVQTSTAHGRSPVCGRETGIRACQAGGSPESTEGVDNQSNGRRLTRDGFAKGGVGGVRGIRMLCDVRKAHPAEGMHHEVQGSGDNEEGHEEAVVSLQATGPRQH